MSVEQVLLVGLNHITSPVRSREKAAVPHDELLDALLYLRVYADLEELAVVSTCSRIEILASAADPAAAAARLKQWLMRRAGAEVGPAIYGLQGYDAVHHLFRVAAGLDSWILGESEILSQIKEAYHFALEHGGTRRTLNRVFQRAIGAGKDIRTRTGIQNGIHSIGGAAALLAKGVFGGGRAGQVVVFGAGRAAEAVARHLAAKSFDRIVVANRTLERAQAVAEPLGGEAVSFEDGMGRLREAEVAIFSTSSPEPLLSAEAASALLPGRKRPLFLIDLGVPRNIDSACAGLEGVHLYNLDDLQEVVRASCSKKESEKEQAEVLASLAAGRCAAELDRPAARPAGAGA